MCLSRRMYLAVCRVGGVQKAVERRATKEQTEKSVQPDRVSTERDVRQHKRLEGATEIGRAYRVGG